MRRAALTPVLLASLLLATAACAPQEQRPSAAPVGSCAKAELNLVKAGRFTVGTDTPAFAPWFKGEPSSGEGFESAVAYAVAGRLGFARTEVDWVTVPFTAAYAPGAKSFDLDFNQVSITPARAQTVDFSTGYYQVRQALVAPRTSRAASARTLAELRSVPLGAMVGTTSLEAITKVVGAEPTVLNDNNDLKSALVNGTIQGAVVDLPTAVEITTVQLPGSVIVGQFAGATKEEFGAVLAKDSPLTGCVNQAIGQLRASGELDRLTGRWLPAHDAPTLR